MEALVYAKAPETSEVSVSFADPEGIRILNRDYRQVDEATDVLSFPFYEEGCIPSETDMPIVLGDIVICAEIAARQANEYGHSYERELKFLAVHGTLHLMGYDHGNPQYENEMRRAQRDILGGPH
jgi:probable rRNA maturation factor